MGIVHKKSSFKKFIPLMILALPGVLLLFIFNYIPMVGILSAFQDYKISWGIWGIFFSPYIGFKNFEKFFNSIYFSRILINTLVLNLYSFIFGFWIPILLALLFNELNNIYMKKFVQTVSYLPYFLSSVIIIGILNAMISPTYGIINGILGSMGLNPIFFLGDPKYFRTLYTIIGIWQYSGWSSIIYVAAITSINPELYESSVIDGANRFQRAWHITLPGIAGIIMIMLIFTVGNALNADFEKVFLMSSPPIYETADIIDTYVYRVGLLDGNWGYGAAVGLFKSAIGLVLVFITHKTAKRTTGMGLF